MHRSSPRSLRNSLGYIHHRSDHILAVGLVAMVFILAFVTYPKVQSSVRAEQTSKDLTLVAQRFDAAPAWPTTEQSARQLELLPATWTNQDHLYNVWGGAIHVTSEAAQHTVSITMDHVPVAECAKMLAQPSDGWSATDLNGHIPPALTPNVNALFNACETNENNTLTWVHKA